MITDEELLAVVNDVRAKHPNFVRLEDAMRERFPHFTELQIAFAVCSLLDLLDAEDEAALCETNPGLERVQ